MIAAEGEQKASRALREASSTIAESSAALQLRYLQVSHDSREHTRAAGDEPPLLDPEFNIGRKEFNNYFPNTFGYNVSVCEVRQKMFWIRG